MNKWILRQKERHNHLEKSLGAKDKRFLFTEHKKKKPKNVSYTTSNSSKGGNEDVVDKLRKLNELYKSGALTKEEFDIAKKRILK